ncbi:MAG: HAMP domain-containing protein [Firmicutes bacterium]|nr:HAMP domain-containing protein [Bacillota bacterium]
MKLDIENKILFPFMILIMLSIIVLGMVSYLNGYHLLLDIKERHIKEELKESIIYIEDLNERITKGEIKIKNAKKEAISYFERVDKKGIFIIKNGNKILDNSKDIKINNFNDKGRIEKEEVIYIYERFKSWNWIIGYELKKDIFSKELLDMQKDTLLIAIIFLVISMEATILIAYNISRPIKMLADTCNKIAKGDLKEKINLTRKDEIGVLARAFNNMIYQLQLNTKKLLKMKNFNENILNNTSTGMITTDREGNIISINKSAQKIIQKYKSKKEEINKSLKGQINKTIKLEKEINDVYEYALGDNELFIDVTTSLLKTDDRKFSGVICSFNDITNRKTIEKRMEKVNRLTSTGQLAAGLAHEIRNPLSGMRMSVQILKRRLKNDKNSNKELLDGTLYEIDRINRLVSDLLNFAKPHHPEYEKVDGALILKRSLELLRKNYEKKDIKVNININEKSYIYVDKAQIEQVFINILANAINAMDKEGILSINMDIDSKNYLKIEIKDNGCGISKKNISKIFDPFFTTDSKGTGLGLSVVHKLVVENKGHIKVNSEVNKGTVFIIKLPLYGGEINEENTSD